MPTEMENMNTLASIRKLKDDWDGNGASSFQNTLIDRCINIIQTLDIQPDIFPTGKQSIQLEYENKRGDYLEFEIFDDRVEVFFVDKEENEEEKTYTHEEIDFREWIKRII